MEVFFSLPSSLLCWLTQTPMTCCFEMSACLDGTGLDMEWIGMDFGMNSGLVFLFFLFFLFFLLDGGEKELCLI